MAVERLRAMNRVEAVLDAAKDVALWFHVLSGDRTRARKLRRGVFRESVHGDRVTLKRAKGYERYRRGYRRGGSREC